MAYEFDGIYELLHNDHAAWQQYAGPYKPNEHGAAYIGAQMQINPPVYSHF